MSTIRRLSALFLAALPATASAGVPDPERSGCFPGQICPPRCSIVLSGMGSPCGFRFLADGSGDQLVLTVTLRDGLDTPVPGCSLSVTLETTPLTDAVCFCSSARLGTMTDPSGAAQFVYSRIGGRGELSLELSSHCAGNLAIASQLVTFTSPDLNASCEAGVSTNVIDLGAWASGLPPTYQVASDYNCDGSVNVVDLGFWAGGLGAGCGP